MTDNDDIVDVLHEWVSPDGGYVTVASDLLANAAHEIERLRLVSDRREAGRLADQEMHGRLVDLVLAWVDACDAGGGPEHIGAVDNLRKAVGR